MRSTTPLVIILQATSLVLAAPTAFRRDQTGPAPALQATCSQDTQDHSTHLHGAVQLCLRMTLSDLATGPLTPSAVELIKCRDDDSAAATSPSKSASPSGNHGNPPSRINAEENSAKKGDHPAKPNSKPASNNNQPEKPSNSPHHDSQVNQGSPKSDPKPGETKHSASSPAHKSTQSDTTSSAQTGAANPSTVNHSASAQPSHSPAVHNNAAHDSDHSKGKGQSQPAPSTHAPAPSQSSSSSGSRPSGPGEGPTSGSDDGDDGSGIPRINLDHLQPLVEVKANVKALDNAKDGKGVLDTAGGKNIADHENVTDPTSRLPSPGSVDKIADVNASVIKNPGPSNAVSDDQVKDKVNSPATSKVSPQETGHNPATETVGQHTSDPIEATPKHPAEGLNAPVHDAARVDVHGSATKDGVVRMV